MWLCVENNIDLPTKESDAIEFLHGCPRFIFVFAVKENLNPVGWKQYAYNLTLLYFGSVM